MHVGHLGFNPDQIFKGRIDFLLEIVIDDNVFGDLPGKFLFLFLDLFFHRQLDILMTHSEPLFLDKSMIFKRIILPL